MPMDGCVYLLREHKNVFYIMQVVKNQRWGRPGYEANHIFIQPRYEAKPVCDILASFNALQNE